MKRIVVICILLTGLKLQAQNFKINAASFSESFSILNDQKLSNNGLGSTVIGHQQNAINNISNNIAEIIKDGENTTTSNIVVQEELVAGRVGSGNNKINGLFNKIKYRICEWNLIKSGK